MRNRNRLVTALITLITCVTLGAQQLATFYSVDQGLPQSTVTSLYRDNAGFLWVGTGDGLGVFDGWSFRTIRKSSGNKASISNSTIRGIVPSQDQKTVWVGTEGGFNQFDRFSLKLIRKYDIVKKPGAAQSPVFANDTAVWVMVAGTGVRRVRLEDGKTFIVCSRALEGSYSLLDDGRTLIYTDTSSSIVSVDLLTGKTITRPLSFGLTKLSVPAFKSFPGRPNSILVLTLQGLYEMDRETLVMTRFVLQAAGINDSLMRFRSVTFHPDGSWWFAVVGEGVYRYDPVAKTMRPCFWQQDGSYIAGQMKSPTAMVCDEYGVVWCGADGFGLVKMLHGRVMFREKYNDQMVTDTCNWFTRCFYELSSQRYLVGTFQRGLNLIDETNNTVTHLITDQKAIENTPLFITGAGGSSLLIGTNQGLYLLDTITWKIAPMTGSAIVSKKFTGFLHLRDGRLLICGLPGVYEYSALPFPHLSESPVGNVAFNVSCLYERNDGVVIAALVHVGIAELSKDWTDHKLHDYEKSIGLNSSTLVRGMFEDGFGRLWLGTDAGLVAIGDDYNIRATITVENGLPDNNVYATRVMQGGMVAVSTGHGIVFYNSVNDEMNAYSYADGLPSNECNSGALLYSATGSLYIGTTLGFVKWKYVANNPCFRAPSVLVSQSSSEGTPTGIVRDAIIQDYGEAAIELLIWQTDFAFPERVVFNYQLEGSGESRTEVVGLRKLNYAALASGFYSFMCTANVPGCPVPKTAKLFTIKIIPPYWMSGWFIGISIMAGVLVITLVLFIVMRVRYQRKIRKLKMQQELDKVRQRISRDIHDEIGAGLTRIALSGDLMSQKIAPDDAQYLKLKTIAGTARELSQSMKEVVWSVNPHYDSLDHMAAYFRSYVAGVAENADLRFVYKTDDHLPAEGVNPETRRNLLLILKETISNSVKYSACTELYLEIRWEHKTFRMVIADNGKGFELEGPSGVNSNGLRNIRQRADASRCTVEIVSAPGKGTRVTVSGSVT